MNDGEEPPTKTILMLPDDLLLNSLARVSRSYYPTLSLICKRFRSLLASTELYQTRTLLGRTETCLYVCLRLCTTDSELLYWFILGQRSYSSRKILVPVSSPTTTFSGVAAVGPNIYAMGGQVKNKTSSSVMVMDSRSHTWREAPSMLVPRKLPSACTLDGKIYVIGGCDNLDSTNWMEVFDTKTQTWELLQIPSEEVFDTKIQTWKFLQIPSEEICRDSKYESVSYEGTVYVGSDPSKANCVTYKLHEGRWSAADMCKNHSRDWSLSCCCVIENVFYCYIVKKIYWYDPKERVLKTLRGLEGLTILPVNGNIGDVKLADYGGKLVILWDRYVIADKKKAVYCLEIGLERRHNLEIWGTLEWFDTVFMSDGLDDLVLVHALTTTVW